MPRPLVSMLFTHDSWSHPTGPDSQPGHRTAAQQGHSDPSHTGIDLDDRSAGLEDSQDVNTGVCVLFRTTRCLLVCCITLTTVPLVRVVPAVVVMVTHPVSRDALCVVTSELAFRAGTWLWRQTQRHRCLQCEIRMGCYCLQPHHTHTHTHTQTHK